MNHTSVRVLPCCSQGMGGAGASRPPSFCCKFFFRLLPLEPGKPRAPWKAPSPIRAAQPFAGAQLTVTNDATGLKFQTTTDSDGLFTFPVLPVGSYTVEVGHAGFSKLTRKDVKLTVGARLNLALALSVAGQGEIRHCHE